MSPVPRELSAITVVGLTLNVRHPHNPPHLRVRLEQSWPPRSRRGAHRQAQTRRDSRTGVRASRRELRYFNERRRAQSSLARRYQTFSRNIPRLRERELTSGVPDHSNRLRPRGVPPKRHRPAVRQRPFQLPVRRKMARVAPADGAILGDVLTCSTTAATNTPDWGTASAPPIAFSFASFLDSTDARTGCTRNTLASAAAPPSRDPTCAIRIRGRQPGVELVESICDRSAGNGRARGGAFPTRIDERHTQ